MKSNPPANTVVLFEDACDLRLLPYLGNSWGQKQKNVRAPGVNQKSYCFGALIWGIGRTLFRLAPRKTSPHFLAFLKQAYRTIKQINPSLKLLFILDNYAIHKTRAVQHWFDLHTDVTVLWLPTYAPQLNPVEKIWWLLTAVLSWIPHNTRHGQTTRGHLAS